MCNDYANRVPFSAYREAFSQTRLPLVGPEAPPNLEPRDDIRPTDPAPILRLAPGGVELVSLRWGFAPARPKAGPVINFRSEGRRFGAGRVLAPVSWFYEFTGSRYPKTKWRFRLKDEVWFCLAALARPATGDWPESFTLLTTPPGADVAPYHDRQVAVLRRDQWEAWLDPAVEAQALLGPLPEGSLLVDQMPAQGRADSLL
jgi:putative SOS response-associated peptidase YedK